jgi:hypothetical protein
MFVNKFTVCDVIVNGWCTISSLAKILKTVRPVFDRFFSYLRNTMLKKQNTSCLKFIVKLVVKCYIELRFSSVNIFSFLPQRLLDLYFDCSAVVHIHYMDSWQGIWTHFSSHSVYSPSLGGSGEYKLLQGIWVHIPCQESI